MKGPNTRQQIFIRELLLHGNRSRAYLKAYPGAKPSAVRKLAWKLMQKPYIRQALQALDAAMLEKAMGMQSEMMQEKLNLVSGMKDLLGSIVNGKIKTRKVYKTGARMKSVEVPASIAEMLSAVNINLKIMKALAEEGK